MYGLVNRLRGGRRSGGLRYGANLLGQAAGRGVYLAAGFAAFVMVGHGVGPEALGRYGLALAVLAVALIAADFGTTLTFGSRLGAGAPEMRAVEFGRMVSARLILGLVTGVALLCALPLLPVEIRPALALAAVLMPFAAARFLDSLFQVCGRPGWSIWPSLANAGTLVGGTALALWLQMPEAALSVVAVASGIVYGLAGLILAARLVPLRPASLSHGWATIRAAAGVGISNALGSLNGRISLIMLAALAGAAELGQFTAGFRFFELGAAVAITLCAPLVPVFGRAVGPIDAARPRSGTDRLRASVRPALTLILAASIAGTVAACAVAEPLVRLVFGPNFSAAAPVLRIAAAMSALLIAATVLFAGLVPLGRTGFAVRGSAAACATNLAACAVLIPWNPLLGAAWAALLAEVAMLAVVAHAFWREAGAPLALADAPIVLGPGLVTALVWAAGPAALVPVTVPIAAGLFAAVAAWLCLRRRAPADLVESLPLSIPEASS
ncbi:oligosaccharide flippase family protein [Methylobacterium pseudosasicola]|uniref:Membrane protein involved in the export of O-antigen and teichoic acid n=1 Tax=Methylobacterium pseudosasicola TaxID=582667 RepID=A0A1I4LRV0_9HYPH|nr:oligosaccharide flippase family protein [Methylobacterium pseudosasicola]SFL93752.1 Membrane protein involved in the export of O-antigen and teichoic acid [Methylobacterium pseudosasicola]